MSKSGRKDIEIHPIVGRRRLHKIGGSYAITIPAGWFEAHGFKEGDIDNLLVVANTDIRIVNPVHERAVYDEVTKIARDVR